jgi:hypothetical protein
MDEPTHIMRDGIRIDLTEEQKAEYRQIWALGEAKIKEEQERALLRAEEKKRLLSRLNLTEDELALLKGL